MTFTCREGEPFTPLQAIIIAPATLEGIRMRHMYWLAAATLFVGVSPSTSVAQPVAAAVPATEDARLTAFLDEEFAEVWRCARSWRRGSA